MTKKTLTKQRQMVAHRLPDPEETVRGTLVRRFLACGKAECRCHRGRGHGPYYYLMTTMAPGKTRMVLLSTDQLKMVGGWVKNFTEYRKHLQKITDINTRLLQVNRQLKNKPVKGRAGKKRQ